MAGVVKVAIIGHDAGLHGSLKGAERDLDSLGKSGESNTKKLGDSFGKMAKAAALGTVAVGVMAVGVGVVLVKAGDKLNEVTGNLNNTLKDQHQNVKAADQAVRDAVPSFQKLAVSQVQLTEGVNKFVLAGETATNAIKDMRAATDLSASANIDLGTAENALLMIHAGKYRMAAKLLGITKQQLAGWSKEEIAVGHLTAAQKKLLVPMTELQVKELLLSRTHGAAEEKAKSLAGQVAALKTWFENLTAHLGQKLIPIVTEVAAWFGQILPPIFAAIAGWLGHIADYVKAHWPAIASAAHDVGQKFTDLGGVIKNLALAIWPKIQSALEWFVSHKTVMQATAVGIGAAMAAMFTIWAVNAAIAAAATIAAAAPFILIVAGAALVAAGLFILWTKWNEIWNWMWHHKAIAAIIALLAGPFLLPFVIVIGALKAMSGHWADVWRDIENYTIDGVNVVIGILNALITAYDDTIGKIPGTFHFAGGGHIGYVANVSGPDTNARGGGSTGSTTQHFAEGGIVQGYLGQPVHAIVHGGERVLTPAQQGGGNNIYINNPAGIDPGAVVAAISRFNRRNGIAA